MLKTFAAFICCSALAFPGVPPPLDAEAALTKADALAEVYNWNGSARFYAQAERAFAGAHRTKDALYAHIGYIRATLESRSFAETARYFAGVCEQSIVTNDPRMLFKCLIAKGDTDAEIDSAPAESDWRRVLALARTLHDNRWVARATGEIGFHRYVQGDHTTAKKNTAIALLEAHKTGDFAAEIRFSSGIGTGLTLGGFPDMGMTYLDKALALAKLHPESGYPYMAAAGKTMALIQKAHYADAEVLAMEQSQQAESDHRLVKFTQSQLFLADIAIGRHEPAIAKHILLATIEVANHNKTRLLRDVYSKLSDLYRKQGDFRPALRYANEAYIACEDSKDMYLAPDVLLTITRLKLALHKDAEAQSLLQRATDVIEGMLAQTTDVAAREAMLTTMSEVYLTNFALAARHNETARAFAIIEQIRGRFVSELLVNKRELRDLDRRDPRVEDSISGIKLELVRAKTPSERKTLTDRLFYIEQASWVQQRNSGLRSVAPISLKDFRSAMPQSEVFLEYVVGETEAYCMLISKDEARIVRLPGGSTLQARSKALLDDIQEGRDSSVSSKAAFESLVQPLGNLSRYHSVQISPDGVLNTIPFEALRSAQNTYWGATTTITYAPSAGTTLLLARAAAPSLTRTFFGIAGVRYDTGSTDKAGTTVQRGGASDRYGDLSQVHNLPSSEEEVKTAAALLGATSPVLALGQNATKAAFETADLTHFAVVHFAVHARANVNNPDLSYLLLNTAPNQDGFLEPRDIMQHNLHSALVVLSACDTAVGHLQGEEGVANLSRAFLIAGSSSVISTLWSVDDTYALFLMKSFYEHLGHGESTADSLRAAKMAVLAKFGQDTPPKYWAAFILTGDGRIKLARQAIDVESARLREVNNGNDRP